MVMEQQRINIISLEKLTLGYGSRVLFADADVGFGWGEFTALVGRNGSGKSTLLRSIAALTAPLSGRIVVDGEDLAQLSRRAISEKIAFVSTEDVRTANLRVWDVVAIGRSPYTNWLGQLTADDRTRVEEAIESVGMTHFTNKPIDSLSDGERQRVMIARALAQDTPIILLDEPTAFLDLPNKYEICLLLSRLAHKQGKSIIFSTHDLSIALELCDTIAMIEGGRFWYGTAEMLIGSGELQRLFVGTRLSFDSETRTVRLVRQQPDGGEK